MRNNPSGKERQNAAAGALPADVLAVLTALGRTLGILSVYGTDHPSSEKAVQDAYAGLQAVLKTGGTIALGSVKGQLTVNGKPVAAKDAPVKALEKRLAALHLSHLALNKGLSAGDFQKLLAVLCSATDLPVKDALAKSGVANVSIENIQYVAVREGEARAAGTAGTGSGTGSGSGTAPAGGAETDLPSVQVGQIVAFLKGEAGSASVPENVKELLSEPEQLGQMILEAAAVRQRTASMDGVESLADIVIGCLRRTYDGLSSDAEFESARGKATLAQTMLLLEKSVMDRIRAAMGDQHPGMDRRMMAGIRAMEKERELDVLSAHYAEQCAKQEKAEEKIIGFIQQHGIENARAHLAKSSIPFPEWQRLMIQSSGPAPSAAGTDMSVIAAVLEKLDGLMQMAERDPRQAKTAVQDARRGVNDFRHRIETRMDEMEDRVQRQKTEDRGTLLLEISKLTLSMMQPLTVINGSIETALKTADEALRTDLLDLAYQSGQTMAEMTRRMIAMTGYPELSEADGHLDEWKKSS